jgi:hypothetical protein
MTCACSSTATSASSANSANRTQAIKMQFPESWLREFCNPPLTTQKLPTRSRWRHGGGGAASGRAAFTRSVVGRDQGRPCSTRMPTGCACARSIGGRGAC